MLPGGLVLRREELFAVVAVGHVDGGQGIVAGDPVLDGQHGAGGFHVLDGQSIVAHAQTQQYIEVRLFFVHQQGLANGIAHDLLGTAGEGVGICHAHRGLGHGTVLADDGYHIEAVVHQDFVDGFCFPVQAHAKHQTDLLVSGPLAKQDDLFHTAETSVTFGFHFTGGEGYEVVFFFFVKLCGPGLNSFVLTGAAGHGFGQVAFFAANLVAVGTAVGHRVHLFL